ncbi:unnamed protein product [Polarella glacialis]|uniref:Uncharacterized protein n=1 Tax=Polarella glacialis TaxID=89957 RepID=A0A813GZ69_POLGL|nr:unnamed protein product [Polarella glacialis]
MVDANGKQVPVENWANEYSLGHANFGRDTTDVDTSVQDRMDAIELPEDVDRAWAHGGILPGELHQAWQDSCSAFTLLPGRCPPNFPGRCFSLPSWGPYQQAYFAVLCIRRLGPCIYYIARIISASDTRLPLRHLQRGVVLLPWSASSRCGCATES